MRAGMLAIIGVLFLIISLFLSSMLATPELSSFKDCRELFLRAFNKLFVYWGNYTLPGSLSNVSLSIVSAKETLLNVTYGAGFEEPNKTTALSEFTYFIGNSTYFYVYVVPHEDTKLLICLNALITQQRSYLLLPTLISWVCGTTITAYTALTHAERVFRKSLKKRR